MLSWQIDKSSIARIQQELSQLDSKIIKKVARKGLRNWANATKQAIKQHIVHDDPELRKNIAVKVKTLKKNRGIWAGAGVEGGKKAKKGDRWIANRGRWYEDGWTPYPKGRKSGRKGKGWRKGVRGAGGSKIYATKFMERSYNMMMPQVERYLIDSINEFLRTGK